MSSVKVDVVSYARNKLEVRVQGEGHTLLNLLVDELNSDPGVTAAYRVEHPLMDIAYLYVSTDGSKTPLDALAEAAARLSDKLEALRRQLLEYIAAQQR